jgi:hypothetical protein
MAGDHRDRSAGRWQVPPRRARAGASGGFQSRPRQPAPACRHAARRARTGPSRLATRYWPGYGSGPCRSRDSSRGAGWRAASPGWGRWRHTCAFRPNRVVTCQEENCGLHDYIMMMIRPTSMAWQKLVAKFGTLGLPRFLCTTSTVVFPVFFARGLPKPTQSWRSTHFGTQHSARF